MAITKQPYPMRTGDELTTMLVLQCETNSDAAPDGATPSNYVTWARSGVGILTATLAAGMRGDRFVTARAYFLESDLDLRAVFTSYVAATGVITVHTQQQTANAVGNEAGGALYTLQDTTDKTLVVELVVADSNLTAFNQ